MGLLEDNISKKKIFIMAGEASGDLHGSMLVKEMKRSVKSLEIHAVGGPLLEEQGALLLLDSSDFSAMGIVEPLLKLRFYARALRQIENHILNNNIKTAVLIDFPGFNLRLAERLKFKGIKVIYYISPQIWAWHYSRIEKIIKFVDHMVVLYPFEEDIYKREGVSVSYFGNPLVDNVARKLRQGAKIAKLPASVPVVNLLPGSRQSEIRRHLCVMLEAAAMLKQKYDCTIIISAIKETEEQITHVIADPRYAHLDARLVVDNTYRAINISDIVIASSGTVTLETAILGKPAIVIYKIDLLFEILARIFVRTKFISLTNIVAGKEVYPELLQRDANAQRIFSEAENLLDNTAEYNKKVAELKIVKDRLGKPGALKRIAKKMAELIV